MKYNNINPVKNRSEGLPNSSSTGDNPLDIQVGGNHYKSFVIQPVEFIQKNRIPHCEASIIKYACRHRDKNGIEDLLKIKHYVDLIIEMEYKDV